LKRELATYMRKQAEWNRAERQRKKLAQIANGKEKRGRPATPSTTATYAVRNSTQHAKSGTIRGDANHGEA
jgi:hypothetical protein